MARVQRPDVSPGPGVAGACADRLAPVPVRLLGAHLDTLDAGTCSAVDGAVERLAGAFVDWHDALALGRPAPRFASGVPAAPPQNPIGPAAQDGARRLAELMERDGLSAVVADCQHVAGELRRAATAAAAATQRLEALDATASLDPATLAACGRPLHDAARRLAATLEQFAQDCAAMRQRVAGAGADRATRIQHGVAVLRRAESTVRHTAASTLPS